MSLQPLPDPGGQLNPLGVVAGLGLNLVRLIIPVLWGNDGLLRRRVHKPAT